MLRVCVLLILSHADGYFFRSTHLLNHCSLVWQHSDYHSQTDVHLSSSSKPKRCFLSPNSSGSAKCHMILQFTSTVLRFSTLRVAAADATLCLAVGLRNPWKKSAGGMSSPWLQHTPGGGRNASRASKPVLLTNKMQLWMNHRLSPTCWHTHPLTHTQAGGHTHALTRQDRLFHVFQTLITFFSATWNAKIWPEDDWYKQPQCGVFRDLSSGSDWVTSLSFRWRLSLRNTWLCESCSSPVRPTAKPSTGRAQLDAATGLNHRELTLRLISITLQF